MGGRIAAMSIHSIYLGFISLSPIRDSYYWVTWDLHYQQLSLDQVRAFSGWFMGNKTSTLTKYSDMKINAINLNEAGNLVLVNR